MNGATLLFRAGAFVALLLLIRRTLRREGTRHGGILVAYLVAFACFREWVVSRVSLHDTPPYIPQAALGHVGVVNLVVVAGWVFTALLSLSLATMIQRRNLPGTNWFLTLALATLISVCIGYAVEVTGIRVGLWRWTNPHPAAWLPFACPFEIFDAWGTTTFITLSMYSAFRYRLFARSALRGAAVAALLIAVFWIAVAGLSVTKASPTKEVAILYLALATVLGFVAPQSMLGSSGAALAEPRLEVRAEDETT